MSEVDLSSPDVADKIKVLQEKLGIEEENLTPEAIQAQEDAPEELEILGKDVNWDDYELDPNLAHFYPRAKFAQTAKGDFAWTVEYIEYRSETKTYMSGRLNKIDEPAGLGEYLTFMVNGPDPWRVMAIFPNGAGLASIVLERKVRIRLPEPVPVETETKVDAPTDGELKSIEKEGLAWAGTEDDKSERDEEGSEKVETP